MIIGYTGDEMKEKPQPSRPLKFTVQFLTPRPSSKVNMKLKLAVAKEAFQDDCTEMKAVSL